MAEAERLPMAAVQNILLDVAKDEEQVRVSIRRGDANRWVWRFCLLDDGVPLDLAGVDVACISIQKPDGTHIWNPCVINGDVIEYTVTSETVSVDGQLHGQVELYAGEMDAQGNLVPETLKTTAFRVVVLENVFGEDTISSSNEYDMLTQAVAGVAALQKKFPVKTADVADGAVTEAKIADGAVSDGKIAQGLRTGILHTMYVHRLGNGAVLYYNYTGNDMDDVYVMARPFGGAALQTTGLDMDADAGMQNYANDSEAFGVVDACGQTLRYKDLPFFGDGQSRVILKLERANSRMVAVDVERGYTIPDGAVTTNKIGAGAVTEGKIADGAVTTNKLGYEAVTSGKINGDAVGTHHMQDGAVTPKKTSFVSSATTGKAEQIVSTTNDNGDKVWTLTDSSRQYYCFDSAWDGGVTCKIMDYHDATEPSADAGTVTYNGRTYRVLTITGTAPSITMDMSSSGYVQEFSVIYFSGLTIPDLILDEDNLADNSVTMPKWSADVREALQSEPDLSNYYTKSDTDAAIRDAMYTVVDATANSDGTYSANGIKLSVSGDHAVVGDGSGDTANALWITQELIIPAYIRIPSGEVYAVTEIGASSLTCNALTMSFEYKEARVYIPRTVKTYGANCFDQYYGDASGHLHIVTDSPVPTSVYAAATTTVYKLYDPLGVVDLASKASVKAVADQIGDIDTALDSIIAVQNSLIGGTTA